MSEKPYQLDKKELTKDLPVLARPIANAFIDWLNKLDVTKDGKSDVGQYAPLVQKAWPVIAALIPLIDWQKVLEWVLDKFAKDKSQAQAKVAELQKLADDVQTA